MDRHTRKDNNEVYVVKGSVIPYGVCLSASISEQSKQICLAAKSSGACIVFFMRICVREDMEVQV